MSRGSCLERNYQTQNSALSRNVSSNMAVDEHEYHKVAHLSSSEHATNLQKLSGVSHVLKLSLKTNINVYISSQRFSYRLSPFAASHKRTEKLKQAEKIVLKGYDKLCDFQRCWKMTLIYEGRFELQRSFNLTRIHEIMVSTLAHDRYHWANIKTGQNQHTSMSMPKSMYATDISRLSGSRPIQWLHQHQQCILRVSIDVWLELSTSEEQATYFGPVSTPRLLPTPYAIFPGSRAQQYYCLLKSPWQSTH